MEGVLFSALSVTSSVCADVYQTLNCYRHHQKNFPGIILGIGIGDWGREGEGIRGAHAPLKFGKNIFRAIIIRTFFRQNHVKFRNFVNFSEKFYKNLGILLIFRARIM